MHRPSLRATLSSLCTSPLMLDQRLTNTRSANQMTGSTSVLTRSAPKSFSTMWATPRCKPTPRMPAHLCCKLSAGLLRNFGCMPLLLSLASATRSSTVCKFRLPNIPPGRGFVVGVVVFGSRLREQTPANVAGAWPRLTRTCQWPQHCAIAEQGQAPWLH